jgi:hypothetical protein
MCPVGSSSPMAEPCPPGRFSSPGSGMCTACPAGLYGADSALASEACSGQCGAGRYERISSTWLEVSVSRRPARRPAGTLTLCACVPGTLIPSGSATVPDKPRLNALAPVRLVTRARLGPPTPPLSCVLRVDSLRKALPPVPHVLLAPTAMPLDLPRLHALGSASQATSARLRR